VIPGEYSRTIYSTRQGVSRLRRSWLETSGCNGGVRARQAALRAVLWHWLCGVEGVDRRRGWCVVSAPASEQIPEVEVVEEVSSVLPVRSTAVVSYGGSTELIAGASPEEQIERAVAMATALDKIIRQQGMRTKMGRRKVVKPDGKEVWEDSYHTNVEAWQTLATFLGVAIVPEDPEPIRDDSGNVKLTSYEVVKEFYSKGTKWEQIRNGSAVIERVERAMVEGAEGFTCRCLVYKDGVVVGAGSSRCTRLEESWRSKPDYALEGMAQTRAIGRSMATPGRWIVTLAGYNGTPAEEMPPQAEQAPGSVGPPFGPAASPEVATSARKAVAWALDPESESVAVNGEEVTALLTQIEKRAGGYLPNLVALAVGHVAAAAKARRVAQFEADAAKPGEGDPTVETDDERLEREKAEAIAAEHGGTDVA
jgi:hypothetical protein